MSRSFRRNVPLSTSKLTPTQRYLIIALASAVVLGGVAVSQSAALRERLGISAASKPLPTQQPSSPAAVRNNVDLLRMAGVKRASRQPSNLAIPLAPTVSATKTDSLFTDVDSDLQADPGDTLKYTVTIGASGEDATGVTFTDTVDPNTAFVGGTLRATPVAVNDSYVATGNVRISVPAPGVLGNDFAGIPSATISAPATSANGGDVAVNADGSFTYNPPAGFEGPDTFTYTLTNSEGSNPGTVTINVSGMIWFINNNASCPCDGRLTTPFNTLASFAAVNNGVGNNPAANDNIFLYESAIDYVGPVTLLNGQRFIGQDATASLSSITGLTPPSYSDPLPATNSGNGTIVNITSASTAITVASGNTLVGFTGGDAVTDISGAGFGTLTISDVTLNGTGQALNLTTGTLAATFVSISSTNSATTGISLTGVAGTLTTPTTTITNPTGIGISVGTSGGTLNFGNTTSTGSGGTGVSLLTNTGAITFGALNISPDSNQRGLLATDNSNTITSASGTISTSGAPAVEITRGVGTTPLVISLTSVSTSGGLNGIKLTNTSGSFTVTGDGSMTAGLLDRDGSGGTLSSTTGDSVSLTNTQNVTLRQMNITNAALDGVEATGGNNVTLSAVDINTPGSTNPAPVGGFGSGNGFRATNVTGDIEFDNNSRVINWQASQSNAVLLHLTSTNFTSFTVDNAFITTSATGAAGIHANLNGATTGTVTLTDTDLTLIDQNGAQILNNGSGTITSVVQRNNFHDADATGGDGNNTLFIAQSGSGVSNFTVGGAAAADGNTFHNLARLVTATGVIAINCATVGQVGSRLNGSVQNNNINNSVGFVNGRRAIDFGIEANGGSHGGHSILVANNTINNVNSQGINMTWNSVAGGDVLNNNFTIRDNLLTTVGTQGNVDSGSGIELECNVDATNTGADLSANILVQGNSVQNSNTSALGTTFEVNNRNFGGNNTSSINLTVLGNTFTNNAAGEVVEILNVAGDGTGAAGLSTCLDLNSGNTSPNNAVGGNGTGFKLTNNKGTFSIEGMGASTPSAFLGPRNQSNGVSPATITAAGAGGFTSSVGCANSSAITAEISSSSEKSVMTYEQKAEMPIITAEDILYVGDGNSADQTNATSLPKEALTSTVLPAAIERWRQAGISANDLARLQAVTFEVVDLPDGQLATSASTHVRLDGTAAGYGWFLDPTPMDDQEFDLPVPARELQSTEYGLAHGSGVDVLTVVMRELGAVYLQGNAVVPKQLRPLMQNTLSPSVRRLPDPRTISSKGRVSGANQSGKEKTLVAKAGKRSTMRAKTGATAPVSLRTAGFKQTASRQSSRLLNHAARNRTTPASVSSMLADVMLNIGTLPAGESVTITFNVTVDDPFTGALPQVSNQGTVSGSNFADVLTDDPTVGGAADPTVTPIDLPDVSVAVSPASVAEDGATNLVYTFTRNGSTANAMTVNFSIGGSANFGASPNDYTQTGAATFTPPTGTVTFGAGNSTATVTVNPESDTTVETDETVVLTVTSGAGYEVGAPSSASGTITNDDTDVSVAVSPASVTEDGAGNLVYTFTRVGVTTNALTVNFSIDTGGNNAVFPADYAQSGAATFVPPVGTVTFGAGNSTATVTVDPTPDLLVEADETVIFTVTSGAGYNVGSPASATGTITNDDADVSATVAPGSATEDGATNLVYTFTRTGFNLVPVTVNFSVAGTAVFSEPDYSQTGAATFTDTSGTVVLGVGATTATVTIDPSADTTVEPDETVILTVTAGVGYNVGSPDSATGTITNDDTDVSVAVSPGSVAEDGATDLVYTFTRNGVTSGALTVNFSVSGSAVFSEPDYTQTGAATYSDTSGTVVFGAGASTATVTVDPSADTTVEPDETVVLTVAAGAGYNVASPTSATGTITNDDTDVSVAVSPASVAEDGATNLVYTFTRNGVTSGAVTVNFSVGGTASFGASPNDYTQTGATSFTSTSGTVTFGAGNSTAAVTVNPETDTIIETDETVILTVTAGTGYNVSSPSSATGTITNDDADVSVAVSPASVTEDGVTNLVYTFTRTGFTAGALTVNFSVGGTASFTEPDYTQTGATTYTATTGSVTFAPGSPTAMVTVDPETDTTAEADETVIITLTPGASYNAVSPASATGTILNDDTLVSVVVTPTSTSEGGANLVYTFTRTGPTGSAVTANFSVGGSASFPGDYSQSGATTFTPPTATVTFGVGSSTATVTVTPLTDCTVEGDETVEFTVEPGSGYGVGSPSTATGTITNTPDSGAPTITLIPNVNMTLWPPNHDYTSVAVTDFVASASDDCDPTVDVNSVYILKISSDEVEDGAADGNTLNDIVIGASCKTAQLRAERSGSGDGRVYTITFKVKDSAGNFTTATAQVTVRTTPNSPAVDSGPAYTVNSTCP